MELIRPILICLSSAIASVVLIVAGITACLAGGCSGSTSIYVLRAALFCSVLIACHYGLKVLVVTIDIILSRHARPGISRKLRTIMYVALYACAAIFLLKIEL